MRGMRSDDLLAIVDFLYRGEAKVFQENLDSFLAIAEELQLEGLMGKTDVKVEDFEDDEKNFASNNSKTNPKIAKTSLKREAPNSRIYNPGEEKTIAISSNFSGDVEELEERVKSMMEKSENKYANRKSFC